MFVVSAFFIQPNLEKKEKEKKVERECIGKPMVNHYSPTQTQAWGPGQGGRPKKAMKF